MPQFHHLQDAFNAGEFSSLLDGRVTLEKYFNAVKTSVNWQRWLAGPATIRPGVNFVAETKNGANPSRLVPFRFSTVQAYVLEMGDQYFRFFMDRGQIAGPYEVSTPFLEADIRQVKFSQSADTLFATHKAYVPRRISRTAHTAWTISQLDLLDGPYLGVNTKATTLTPSGTSGAITITASAITGINDNTGFQTTDVGRSIRFKDSAGNWSWMEITARTSTLVVDTTIRGAALATTGASAEWRLGVWSDTTGWPVASTFYGGRFWLAGGTKYTTVIAGSVVEDFENFAPTDPDGTVADDHSIVKFLNADEVNAIRWLTSNEKGLLIGTTGNEWIAKPPSAQQKLTPTNFEPLPTTAEGSADAQVLHVGNVALFVQKSGRRVHELAYTFESDGFRAPDLTLYAQHIAKGGIVELAYQQNPQSTVWAPRADGVLLSMLYNREQDVVDWGRQQLGGVSDANGTPTKVESAAVIPALDGSTDDVWIQAKVYVNGSTKRFIGYMSPLWEEGDDPLTANYLDFSLLYQGAATSVITGLDHLEGETVGVLANGAPHPDKVVTGGQITLDRDATTVRAGLRYTCDLKTMRPEVRGVTGTAQARTKRVIDPTLRVLETGGLSTGPSFDLLDPVIFRQSSDPLDEAVPLFTGDVEVPFADLTDEEGMSDGYFCVRQDLPLPATILFYKALISTSG